LPLDLPLKRIETLDKVGYSIALQLRVNRALPLWRMHLAAVSDRRHATMLFTFIQYRLDRLQLLKGRLLLED
jgi:hypothetical protein